MNNTPARGLVNTDPLGSVTRGYILLVLTVATAFAIAGFTVALVYGITANNNFNGVKEKINILETGLQFVLSNAGACFGGPCNLYGATCVMDSDCPIPGVKADVGVTTSCSFGTCVWLFDPANFGMGSMPPYGPFADAICKQVFNTSDALASGCLTSIAVPDGDGVDGCLGFNGCFMLPEDAFMIVVRSQGKIHPDRQQNLRKQIENKQRTVQGGFANDDSLSVEDRRELLRNNREHI